MSGLRVYLRHARQAATPGAGVTCANGIRGWCDRYGIDLRRLSREGIPEEHVAAINDAFAQKALRIAREEAASGQ